MEDIMDLDLHLDTDRIRDFLYSKLEEIKSTNVQLEKSLKYREEVADKYQNEITKNKVCDQVEINEVCKKLCHNKYILGLGIRNTSELNLENVRVILNWDSLFPLNYKFYLISSKAGNHLTDGIKWTNHIETSGKIIIVFDVPFFNDQLSYTITGSISFHQNHIITTLKLPSAMKLIPDDATDNSTIVQMYSMIDGNIDDLLACVHSSDKHEFVMVIPSNWTQLLETTLELDCSLRKINIISNKKFFVAHKLSSSLEGAILEIEDSDSSQMVYLNTYCRDQNVLVALIHYLHRHIINVIIVPRSLYQPDLSLVDTTELVKNSLLKEIDSLENFSGGNLMDFRSKMADLEYKSDVLISRMNEDVK